VLVSIPIFILFSPHISKLVVRAAPVEMEMKSPKDFEFILHPCLMDDIVRKIDDVPD
jgi:phenylalanine-4-hydroxylase